MPSTQAARYPGAPMRVAALQFDVRRGDVPANLAAVEQGLLQAAEREVELVVLPEMWPTSFVVSDGESEDADWVRASEEAVLRVAALSRELELVVAGSAFAPGRPGQRPRNRMSVHEHGELVLAYDKLQLFSPTAEDEGFSGGEALPPTVATRCGKLAGVVCYDLRFGACLRAPFLAEAELLLVSAQWPDTRASHWRALVCGRAVEHQAFVLAANRTGTDLVGRRKLELSFPGNSLLVGPDGVVRAEGQGEAGLVLGEVELDELRRLRRAVPVRRDERRDVL